MDGNGRWAKKKDLKRIQGHKEGVKVVKEIVKHSVKLGIEYLTLYTLSKENFHFKNIKGLVFDPLSMEWKLSKNYMINYFCTANLIN